jgi:hypothetical protein
MILSQTAPAHVLLHRQAFGITHAEAGSAIAGLKQRSRPEKESWPINARWLVSTCITT